MKSANSIQTKMYADVHDKSLFEAAQHLGQDYLENIFERNVFPSEDENVSCNLPLNIGFFDRSAKSPG